LLLPAYDVQDALTRAALQDSGISGIYSENDGDCVSDVGRKMRVTINQHTDIFSQDLYGTGSIVWDCAVKLSSFLIHHASHTVAEKRIIELGAGTGLVGLVASKLHAKHTLLTDRYRLQSLLRSNVAANYNNAKTTHIECTELDWGNSTDIEIIHQMFPNINLMLCSDLIYAWDAHDIFRNLSDTIVQFATLNSSSLPLDDYIGDNTSALHLEAVSWQTELQRSKFAVLFAFTERGELTLQKSCADFFNDIKSRAGMRARRIYTREFPMKSPDVLMLLTK
jgi:predicted nicotinamide N-methyase